MEHHKEADPGKAAVLAAIKATVRAASASSATAPGRRTAGRTLARPPRPTWRPDIRAAVISTARMNMHRKMRNMAA